MRRALLTAALTAGTLAAALTPPAQAQAPCYTCTAPADVAGAAPTATPTPNPTSTTPAAQPANKPVDATSRSQNFLTGVRGPDEFDPAEHKLWYVERDAAINIPLAPDIHHPNYSDMLWGQISDGFFEFYKIVIDTVVNVVGALVFGMVFIEWLLTPALELGEQFRRYITEPFGLGGIVISVAAIYAAYLWLVKRRPGAAIAEYGMSAMILGLSALLVPIEAIRYVISAVAGAAAVVLLAGTGHDPRGVAAPSTAPVDGQSLVDAYHGFVGSIENVMIGKVAEILVFGKDLPPACKAAYQQGAEQHLSTSDPDNFKFLGQIQECVPYVENAMQPDALRAVIAGLLVLYCFVFAGAYAYIAWPALRGQIQLMFLAATHKFLFLAAALPGGMRAPAVRMLVSIAFGVFALVIVAGMLALMNLLMLAVFAGSTTWAVAWRLLAVLLVPIAMVAAARHHRKSAKRRTKQITETITRKEGREQTVHRSKTDRLVERAQSRGAAAAGGTVAAGAAAVGEVRSRRAGKQQKQPAPPVSPSPDAAPAPAQQQKQPTPAPVPVANGNGHRQEPAITRPFHEDLQAARNAPTPPAASPPTPPTAPARNAEPPRPVRTFHEDLERARRTPTHRPAGEPTRPRMPTQ